MRIGIDISQIVYEGSGVGRYVRELVAALLKLDKGHEYILFGASLRRRAYFYHYFAQVKCLNPRVKLRVVPLPPTFMDILWNQLHILPIGWLVGQVDVFWSSDWTQPPLGSAKGITTIHDVSFLRYPESFAEKIVAVQKRRLERARQECHLFLCDSHATAQDVEKFLRIPKAKLRVVYPGF